MTPENWRDLREWLSRPLERVDPNRLVKFKAHTESILRAMDRLERGESVYENICGRPDEMMRRGRDRTESGDGRVPGGL